jgi:phosphomevalonate kinase
MIGTEATAPGKAVICGEYAVLEGAPAISMAVDRRACVGIVDVAPGHGVVSTPGYAEGAWHFDLNVDGSLSWRDELPQGGLPVFEAAWRRCEARSAVAVLIDTRGFHDPRTGLKLGLGSSAAASTALLAGLRAHLGAQPPSAKECRDLHRQLQGQRGSGVDVATAVHGGLLEFRMTESDPEPLDWPAGLEYRFLWSGQSADTVFRLRKFGRHNNVAASLHALVEAADAVAAAWRQASADELLELLAGYGVVLRRFDVDHALGIFDAGHDRVADQARDAGMVYKPCGAGGGDIGIVLGVDAEAIDTFCSQVTTFGFSTLDLRLDRRGVEVSKGDDR